MITSIRAIQSIVVSLLDIWFAPSRRAISTFSRSLPVNYMKSGRFSGKVINSPLGGHSREIFLAQRFQAALPHGGPDVLQKIIEEINVVQSGQASRFRVLVLEEQVQVPAGGSVQAHRALAFRIERMFVAAVRALLDVESPARGPAAPVPGLPGRYHAVESVDARRDPRENVLDPSHSEKMARPVLRQVRHGPFEHLPRFDLGAAVGIAVSAADGEAVEGHSADELRACAPQVLERSALDHAVHLLVGPLGFERALRPSVRPLHGGPGVSETAERRGRLVESHDDVRAQMFLDANGGFRVEIRFLLALAFPMEIYAGLGHPDGACALGRDRLRAAGARYGEAEARFRLARPSFNGGG